MEGRCLWLSGENYIAEVPHDISQGARKSEKHSSIIGHSEEVNIYLDAMEKQFLANYELRQQNPSEVRLLLITARMSRARAKLL